MKQQASQYPVKYATHINKVIESLTQLYTETNKPGEVKKWQAEKDKLTKPVEKK